MIEPNLDPHEQAVLELEYWKATGIRHAFDPELVVMADLTSKGHKSSIGKTEYENNN